MSRKFYAVNRHTGERWKPNKDKDANFLVMYDSEYLAEIEQDYYTSIRPLNTRIWKAIIKK